MHGIDLRLSDVIMRGLRARAAHTRAGKPQRAACGFRSLRVVRAPLRHSLRVRVRGACACASACHRQHACKECESSLLLRRPDQQLVFVRCALGLALGDCFGTWDHLHLANALGNLRLLVHALREARLEFLVVLLISCNSECKSGSSGVSGKVRWVATWQQQSLRSLLVQVLELRTCPRDARRDRQQQRRSEASGRYASRDGRHIGAPARGSGDQRRQQQDEAAHHLRCGQIASRGTAPHWAAVRFVDPHNIASTSARWFA